jgi:hypothetical protein
MASRFSWYQFERFTVFARYPNSRGILLMSESSAAVSNAASSVSAAVTTAAEEAVAGAADAVSTAMDSWPGKLLYGICYSASFVVVLPVVLVAALMPNDNILVQGLLDGSSAAQDKAQAWVG